MPFLIRRRNTLRLYGIMFYMNEESVLMYVHGKEETES